MKELKWWPFRIMGKLLAVRRRNEALELLQQRGLGRVLL